MQIEWKRFFWPMVALLVVLIAATIWSYCRYGAVFWDTFYPQFLATVFGVVFSIMFAWALWRLQRKAQESRNRDQLFQNLKSEAAVNSERINDIDVILDESKTPDAGRTWLVTLKGFSFGEHRVRLLRTAAMKNFLKPDNLVLINNPDFEDDIDWLLRRLELYNATLFEAFKRFYDNIDSGKDVKESVADLRSSIAPGIRFLQGFLDGLKQRL